MPYHRTFRGFRDIRDNLFLRLIERKIKEASVSMYLCISDICMEKSCRSKGVLLSLNVLPPNQLG